MKLKNGKRFLVALKVYKMIQKMNKKKRFYLMMKMNFIFQIKNLYIMNKINYVIKNQIVIYII